MSRNSFLKPGNKYVRVGVDYFKVINKPDRFNIPRIELKKWNKETIIFDYDKKFLYKIPTYDDFIINPSNSGTNSVIGNCYNMYSEFLHIAKKGNWKWTFILLKHIFGTQFKSGMIYLNVLYKYPKQALPILTLVSSERQTGKTTFLDWLNMIFGANMAMIEPDVIGSAFNGEYATANIVAIDETILDKQIAVEKIKSLSTKKFISVNIKQIAQFKLPFYGKIILASNNEDKFMRIDDKEIRFWIRKLNFPRIVNHNILEDMIKEIPAFLYYLDNMNDIDMSKSRMVLTPDQIKNEYLTAAKNESRSDLYKELKELFIVYFDNEQCEKVTATPDDIKLKWFLNNHKITRNYIRRVLKNEFGMLAASRSTRFKPFNSVLDKVGKPFTFHQDSFVKDGFVDNLSAPF